MLGPRSYAWALMEIGWLVVLNAGWASVGPGSTSIFIIVGFWADRCCWFDPQALSCSTAFHWITWLGLGVIFSSWPTLACRVWMVLLLLLDYIEGPSPLWMWVVGVVDRMVFFGLDAVFFGPPGGWRPTEGCLIPFVPVPNLTLLFSWCWPSLRPGSGKSLNFCFNASIHKLLFSSSSSDSTSKAANLDFSPNYV